MELTRAFWSTILQIRVPEIKIFYLPEFEPSTNACEAASLPLLHSGGLCLYLLVPWLMEPGGSMPYLQGLFNEPQSCAESIQFLILTCIFFKSSLILSTQRRLGIHRGLFPVGLPVKIFKAPLLLPFYQHVLSALIF